MHSIVLVMQHLCKKTNFFMWQKVYSWKMVLVSKIRHCLQAHRHGSFLPVCKERLLSRVKVETYFTNKNHSQQMLTKLWSNFKRSAASNFQHRERRLITCYPISGVDKGKPFSAQIEAILLFLNLIKRSKIFHETLSCFLRKIRRPTITRQKVVLRTHFLVILIFIFRENACLRFFF